ncbi:hypothetical protein AFK24_05785 [Pseudomonas syringae]|uniref:Secreted protein n=1 Tax=Pseudomonas syringae TaxID=317 RepID=A0A1C7Z7N0_PSESX|nr:hypothetical protein [Pseudomonas syringae]OCR26062.1 hypothetical protein AFK24_05785 [Pseudomonas syringae]
MSTTLLSAVTATLLAAACLTAFADPPKKHNRTSTVSESTSYQPSTNSAPNVEYNNSADNANGPIQAIGRSGSHSMHPNAPVAAEQFADDEVEASQQIGDDYPNAPGSN